MQQGAETAGGGTKNYRNRDKIDPAFPEAIVHGDIYTQMVSLWGASLNNIEPIKNQLEDLVYHYLGREADRDTVLDIVKQLARCVQLGSRDEFIGLLNKQRQIFKEGITEEVDTTDSEI